MKPVVFISYRRNDSFSEAKLLADSLQREFGRSAVFLDTSSMRAGSRWPTEIENALETANVVLVVIGPKWLKASDKFGVRRIDQEGDWVRRELEIAFAANKLIIPIFTKGAKPAPRDKLPSSISELMNRQKLELREDCLDQDIEFVVREVRTVAEIAGQRVRVPMSDPESTFNAGPVTILGHKTEVYLVEGDGEATLEPQHITINLRSSSVNLPPLISNLRQDIVARLKSPQQPTAGAVAPWNSPAMATLNGYRISRTAMREHIVLNLDMSVSDYATFAATVLSLDTEIEKEAPDGQVTPTSLRREYLQSPAEVSTAVGRPLPFLANGVGVVLLAFTDDGDAILTRRRDSSRARPRQRDVSVVEGIHTAHDATSSGRVDVYLTAIRACREELGVSVTNNEVQLLGFGVDLKYYQWNFFGSVELRCSTDEALELHSMNAKDRWEGQFEAVPGEPDVVFGKLHNDGAWDTAIVTAYLAFCKRIGVARTRQAAARAFQGK